MFVCSSRSNFAITQLVDGNWGIHAIIPKSIFEGVERNDACAAVEEEESSAPRFGFGAVISVVSFLIVAFLC